MNDTSPGSAERGIGLLPPVGNTGVEPEAVSLAWLAGTIRSDDDVGLGWELIRKLGDDARQGGQHGYYGHTVHAADGGWQVGWSGHGGAAGTTYVELRQAWLEGQGPQAPTLALELLSRGLRLSRADLAGDDVSRSSRRPREFFDARQVASTRTDRAGWKFTEDGLGRQTLNVGSRTSERCMRLYDHAPGCLRHELELKGATAAALGAALLTGAPVSDLWAEQYARLVRWPDEWLSVPVF